LQRAVRSSDPLSMSAFHKQIQFSNVNLQLETIILDQDFYPGIDVNRCDRDYDI